MLYQMAALIHTHSRRRAQILRVEPISVTHDTYLLSVQTLSFIGVWSMGLQFPVGVLWSKLEGKHKNAAAVVDLFICVLFL